MTPREYEILFGEPPPESTVLSESPTTQDEPAAPAAQSSTNPANLTGLVVAAAMVAAILVLAAIGILTSS